MKEGRRLVRECAARAHVPYSNRNEAALLILSDATWIPGVRVESASFSLTIPPLLNAVTTAVAGGRHDIEAVIFSRDISPLEHVAMTSPPLDRLSRLAPDCYGINGGGFPVPAEVWDPILRVAAPTDPEGGIRLARKAAVNAYVPESDFPVGCVIETSEGHLVPGVNVEHSDWSRVLCAERNALGLAVSFGFGPAKTLYLSCLRDPGGTPCGACRQLISELAPGSTLWMDRGDRPPESAHPLTLLPGSFTGTSIPRKS